MSNISHEEQQQKQPTSNENHIDFDKSFSHIVHCGLEDIDTRDQLQVIGYFRQTALNEYHMEIPHGIVNYCMMYLFYEDEQQLFIGNLHEKVNSSRNKHHWTMFISTSNTELKPPKRINKVTYYLHPTFHPSKCTKKKSPFELARRGWGTFTVDAKIVFHDKYQRKACWAQHHLSFGHHASITQIELSQQIRIKEEMCPWELQDVWHFHKPHEYPRSTR
eukprot:198374_1